MPTEQAVTDSRTFDYFTEGPNWGQLRYVTHTQTTQQNGAGAPNVAQVRRVVSSSPITTHLPPARVN